MLTNRRILDREIGLDEFECLRRAQWVGFESLGRRLGKAACRWRAHRIGIVEKERYRHVQHSAQFEQPAGPYLAHAAFVFLHLLEGKPDCLAKLSLAEV